MKIIRKPLPFWLFLLVLVWKSSSLAQAQNDTYTGDIHVATQAEVNALAGKTKIDGSLIISGSNITDLTPLSNIQTIGGYFKVYGNAQLTTLGNFTALQSIGGGFGVNNNAQLTTLGNFPALQSIGKNFSVTYNHALLSLGSFPALVSIGTGKIWLDWIDTEEEVDDASILVQWNPSLVLCSWLETGANAVKGGIYINFNATGCETNNPVLLTNNPVFAYKDSTTTSFNIYANVSWQLVTSDDATWITSLSSGSSTHSSRITGENEASITLVHTLAPNETPRSTTLTLTAIDENGEELTNPAAMTINFTQLSTVYEGNIILESQEEVNEFTSNATAIDGDLTIGYTDKGSASNITDLTPLSNIIHITGSLSIQRNGQLINLNALNNLQSIGGGFEESNNAQLTTLGDFPFLQSIGGGFGVGDNAQLTTLGNFPALQSIGGYFWANNNYKLLSLGNFPALMRIGIGYAYVPSLDEYVGSHISIVVENNPSLVLCSWLENFLSTRANAVRSYIYINNNATGCNSTEEINNPPLVLLANNPVFAYKDNTTTSFNIYANVSWQLVTSDDATWITSLSSGSSTHSSRITGENEASITLVHTRAPNETPRSTTLTLTAIDENGEELTNPAAMTINFTQRPIVYEGDVILESQEEVNEFTSNATAIDGDLTIGYTAGTSRSNITDLTPLSNIIHITGSLSIQRNGQLINLNALNNLQSIGGGFEESNNAQLTTLGDFPALQSIGGGFWVGDNAQLTTLGNFPTLQSIGGGFGVGDNAQLTTLGDFPFLQSIGEGFWVGDNAQLTTLGDFPFLQSIGGGFWVGDNAQLTTLGSFPNLTSIGIRKIYVSSLDEYIDNVSIVVENNSSLSDCSVLASFLNPENNKVEGDIFITNNATGCDDENTNQILTSTNIKWIIGIVIILILAIGIYKFFK